MKRTLVPGLAIALAAGLVLAGGKDNKPKPTVHFAPTWEAAVEEAKALNVPIVVHSHGFY